MSSVAAAPTSGFRLLLATRQGDCYECSPLPADPTGRGLRIVSALSDEWGVLGGGSGGGKAVWFRVDLQGGARVSEKHANFIVNPSGDATAADIEALIIHVRETVRARTGVDLEPEVRIIGEARK